MFLCRVHSDERGLVGTLFVILLASLLLLFGAVQCTIPERVAKEEAKAAQAKADTAASNAAAEAAKAKQAHWDFKTAEENRLEAEKEVELEQVKGDNLIKEATANTIEWQAVGHIGLQVVWVLIAAAACFGFGLLIAWVLESHNSPLRRGR